MLHCVYRGAVRYRVNEMGLFRKKMKQEHKVMLQHERAAGALLPEYHRATPELSLIHI